MHINELLPIYPKLLGPFMDFVADELIVIVKMGNGRDGPCAILEIFADFLRFRPLIEAEWQKKCVGTLLACVLLMQNAPQFAKLKNQGDRVSQISMLCGLTAEPPFSPDGEVETVENTLIEHAQNLPIAYRCAKHTRSLLSFFKCALTFGKSFDDRAKSLANFARDKQRIIVYSPTNQTWEQYAKKLARIMRARNSRFAPSKESMRSFLQKSDQYEDKYKGWVESAHFDTLYALARIEFRKSHKTLEEVDQIAL